MIQKYGQASWQGGLRDGQGQVSTETGVLSNQSYDFAKRFGDQKGTNPEELIGAAHASCFAMALSADLERAGLNAENIDAKSTVSLDMSSGSPVISRVHVEVAARVPGASEDQFRQVAEETKQNCPVSKVLSGGAQITMNARLD
ncbi:OsmC family protein [Rubellimicrobium rubrum]|uniref:OsmC family protein n=1 Tax=Rubellimicrobium rubrum TaxID=2585369 RepID=A0A5C4MXA2_9RHOB|nr:OsmC family protein [Rubellimicrobium rubrum]TNC50732.1 OsmC family protein [Rubellimicrobium rubrum]